MERKVSVITVGYQNQGVNLCIINTQTQLEREDAEKH
jgi:hypothetical protein